MTSPTREHCRDVGKMEECAAAVRLATCVRRAVGTPCYWLRRELGIYFL